MLSLCYALWHICIAMVSGVDNKERGLCCKRVSISRQKEHGKAMQKTESDTKSTKHHAATKQRVPCYSMKRNSTANQ